MDFRVVYLEHVAERGVELCEAACQHDLEGIVGKWVRGAYQSDGKGTSWLKVKNPNYSQMQGRRELFEARRDRQRLRGQRAPELLLA